MSSLSLGGDDYFIRVSGIGHDEPGIVYRITGVIREFGGNVRRLHSLRVAGEFAITLVAAYASDKARAAATQKLNEKQIGERFAMQVEHLQLYEELRADVGLKHIVTIIGEDRIGMIEAITAIFFERGLNLLAVEAEIAEYLPFQGTPTFKCEFTTRIDTGVAVEPLASAIALYATANDLTHHITRLP